MMEIRWKSYVNQGSDIKGLKEKFKLFKAELKPRNMNVFRNLNSIKRSILQEIESFNYQNCNGKASESERQTRMDLVRRLWETDSKLESLLGQKARTNRFRYGDSCSSFFHSSLRWRRLRNEVKGVEVGGIWCEEPSIVRLEAKKLFEARFKATKDFGVRLDGVEFKSPSSVQSLRLIEVFSKEEVKDVVWHCEGSKSPGPNGYNFNFIKKSWNYLQADFVAALEILHKTGYIPKGCNASFIALVPKVKDPCKLDQFRLISLVGSIYKVIAKLLAGRLKKVLPVIIDESQSTFIR